MIAPVLEKSQRVAGLLDIALEAIVLIGSNNGGKNYNGLRFSIGCLGFVDTVQCVK
jgi:hypothetical protein